MVVGDFGCVLGGVKPGSNGYQRRATKAVHAFESAKKLRASVEDVAYLEGNASWSLTHGPCGMPGGRQA